MTAQRTSRHTWGRAGAAAFVAAAILLASGPSLLAQEIEESPTNHAVPFWTGGIAGSGEGSPGGEGVPPNLYSLRGAYLLTPVKNQGACGSCWAFATYGAMESNILVEGGSAEDLSENHLKNYHGFDWGPCEGGNIWLSMAYLSRLDGPVAESDDPYHAWDDRPSPGGPRQLFLRQSSISYDPNAIKSAVMTTGALHTSMYYDGGYYNSGAYTYRYTGDEVPNHAVDIVGWNDNKVVPGAVAPGAWEIRNSWGAGWGDGGYFWISYEDTRACDYGATFEPDPPGVAQRVYYHDYYGAVSYLNSPYCYNVFTATEDEKLCAVGLYAYEDGADYDVRIYDTTVGGGPAGFLAQKTGTLTEGFHVVDLDSLIDIDAGDDFVVYLYITNGGTYPLAFDKALAGYSSGSTANAGESFYSFDGVNWTDLTTYDATANFAVKVYSIPEPASMLLMGLGIAGGLLARRRRR